MATDEILGRYQRCYLGNLINSEGGCSEIIVVIVKMGWEKFRESLFVGYKGILSTRQYCLTFVHSNKAFDVERDTKPRNKGSKHAPHDTQL